MEKQYREIISPEGVEERVLQEHTFRITLTGGGKYRVYVELYLPEKSDSMPSKSFDTLEEAERFKATHMGMLAALKLNPKGTVEMILKVMTDARKEGL